MKKGFGNLFTPSPQRSGYYPRSEAEWDAALGTLFNSLVLFAFIRVYSWIMIFPSLHFGYLASTRFTNSIAAWKTLSRWASRVITCPLLSIHSISLSGLPNAS